MYYVRNEMMHELHQGEIVIVNNSYAAIKTNETNVTIMLDIICDQKLHRIMGG